LRLRLWAGCKIIALRFKSRLIWKRDLEVLHPPQAESFRENREMSDLTKWIVSFALTTVLILVSYQWLDRPIALFAHDHVRRFTVFGLLTTRVPELVAPLAGVALIVVAFRALAKRPLSHAQSVMLLCAVSFFIAEGIKTYLKVAFGRTWPETWMQNNPSLIRDGVYGFNPFHGGAGFTSFPSGHITAVCAVVSVLWICYPKFRPLYLTYVLAAATVLVAANYHFLSDVIAGIFLGASTGWITTTIGRAGVHMVNAEPNGHRKEETGSADSIRTEIAEAKESLSQPPNRQPRSNFLNR
jgi:membrane-associated phospholipid phosphatase